MNARSCFWARHIFTAPVPGKVVDVRGETWSAINDALIHGARGLTGKSSLANLLMQDRVSAIRVCSSPTFDCGHCYFSSGDRKMLAWVGINSTCKMKR
jgi:hypothetical protein